MHIHKRTIETHFPVPDTLICFSTGESFHTILVSGMPAASSSWWRELEENGDDEPLLLRRRLFFVGVTVSMRARGRLADDDDELRSPMGVCFCFCFFCCWGSPRVVAHTHTEEGMTERMRRASGRAWMDRSRLFRTRCFAALLYFIQ